MIEVIAIGVVVLGVAGAMLTLGLKLASAKDEQLEIRDLYEKLDESHDALEVERNGLKVDLDSERKKTAVLTDRVAVVEAERNEAQRKERAYVIERIRRANVADANGIIADLLAAPLVVHKAVPRSEEPTSGDGLMDPSEL